MRDGDHFCGVWSATSFTSTSIRKNNLLDYTWGHYFFFWRIWAHPLCRHKSRLLLFNSKSLNDRSGVRTIDYSFERYVRTEKSSLLNGNKFISNGFNLKRSSFKFDYSFERYVRTKKSPLLNGNKSRLNGQKIA